MQTTDRKYEKTKALVLQGTPIGQALKRSKLSSFTYYTRRQREQKSGRLVALPAPATQSVHSPSGKIAVFVGSPLEVVEAIKGLMS